ncbi:glycoside hydrolase family 15 protein [Ameyamaea chiangmaiensis]|uniref:Trehalase n=1 Tax=Ameyamaea chiangmaiensis TaxID=442969 RepID=A0A850PI81_9PROT|nr:glycoside hydrolase family 15 protein [Ameyamaea chiangmaiensis]MBS4074529.1 glycoside hydrolase family 15 protein [Ameyamaea chiangmaiensis]NVN41946.1 glycoside hydrolase family 15 protein [Ameyamaea chiangmaiensis]
MPLPIESYGLIGDCTSCALVGSNGSIDWLCWPRFDSPACFAALLGDDRNGRWQIAPERVVHAEAIDRRSGDGPAPVTTTRSYRRDGMVLETVFTTPDGEVALIDFMVIDAPAPTIVRIVEGRSGRVRMSMDFILRMDYGLSVPWLTHLEQGEGISAIVGPSRCVLRSRMPLHSRDLRTTANFTVAKGERQTFSLSYSESHLPVPAAIDPMAALRDTEGFWDGWIAQSTFDGPYDAPVRRSLVTLKALTYKPTGGIVAAPTTSLPECLGGSRNWDYRYCWLRDATLTLMAFMAGGYFEEARDWRDWLHRAVAGSPEQVQIMYGLGGERQLLEWEVPWLAGYENSTPVRVGNGAAGQLQLDVYGEIVLALHRARHDHLRPVTAGWTLQVSLLEHLETIWREPDEGIWEVRGGRRHFVLSKISCWAAFDRAVADARQYGLEGPVERWEALRDEIHETVCREGFCPERNSFVQYFGGRSLDASLLLIPQIGFLPPDDPRVIGTVEAIEHDLIRDGLVLRYRTEEVDDGLDQQDEGAFLACSFWLVNTYVLMGRRDDAQALFDRLLALRNDLGLLAEEYDTVLRRQIGNFPQAFSHLALVASAAYLEHGTFRTAGDGGA